MVRTLLVAFVATFIAAVGLVTSAFGQTPSPAAAPTAVVEGGNMRARLAAMDTDHDGKWSKAEWLAGGRKERGFDRMDANHDGFVTREELMAGREKMKAMREAKGQ